MTKFGWLTLSITVLFSCKEQNALLPGSYDNYIGYLNPEITISSEGFEVCGSGKINGTHHGFEGMAYKPNKWSFKKRLQETYRNENYSDSGYVIFRFIINCKGEAGRFEIIQTDLNMEKAVLNDSLVAQLFEFTKKTGNWNFGPPSEGKEGLNYYNYTLYKIQNGAITEILP